MKVGVSELVGDGARVTVGRIGVYDGAGIAGVTSDVIIGAEEQAASNKEQRRRKLNSFIMLDYSVNCRWQNG